MAAGGRQTTKWQNGTCNAAARGGAVREETNPGLRVTHRHALQRSLRTALKNTRRFLPRDPSHGFRLNPHVRGGKNEMKADKSLQEQQEKLLPTTHKEQAGAGIN